METEFYRIRRKIELYICYQQIIMKEICVEYIFFLLFVLKSTYILVKNYYILTLYINFVIQILNY